MLRTKTFIAYLLTSLLLIMLDQSSKIYLIFYFKNKSHLRLKIFPFLDFVYTWNHGISFGLFNQYAHYSNIILFVINSTIVMYLIIALVRVKSKPSIYGLVLIISGAMGNLIDRITQGAVFDFIYFNYAELNSPIFNLADSFILIGIVLFIHDGLLFKKTFIQK